MKKSVKIAAEIKKTNENKMTITEKIKKNHLEYHENKREIQ